MKSAEDRIIYSIVGGVLIIGICLTVALLAFTGKLSAWKFPKTSDEIAGTKLESAVAGDVQDPEAQEALTGREWDKAITRLEFLLSAGVSDPAVARALGIALYNSAVELSDDESSGPAEWSRAIARYQKSDAILAHDEAHRVKISRGYGTIGLRLYESGQREEGKRRIEEGRARHVNDPYLCYLSGAIKAVEGYYADAQPLLATGTESSDAAIRAASAQMLSRIAGDVKAEANYAVAENARLTMRFEGSPRPELAAKIQTILASEEGNIASIVGRAPSRKTEVIIYTSSQFAQARGLPDWVGGLFDGRIRVSAGDASEGDDFLRSILSHEYAHAAVYDLLGRSAPGWLDEGIAQVAQYGSSPSVEQLRSKIAAAGWKPLASLNSNFTGMGGVAAGGAYAQAYAVAGFIIQRNGLGGIQSLLGFMSRGSDVESALQQSVGFDLATLDAETKKWVGL